MQQILFLLFIVINIAFGKNLQKHHVVDIMYDENLNTLKPKHSYIAGDLKGGSSVSDLLRNGKVVCQSCHLNSLTSYDAQKDLAKLRVVSNSSSQLCLWCHNF